MHKPSFTTPDLDAFCLLDTRALTITGQAITVDHAFLECRTNTDDPGSWCRECGTEGVPRGTAVRRLVHVPLGWRPTILHVRVRRYRCPTCARVWREDLTPIAAPRAKLSRPAVLWALKCLVIDRMSISRIAAGLGASWHTVNTAILTTGQQLLLDDPTRFDGVRVLGVDEHVWRHTPFGSKYVTVIIDLTPIRDKRGPSRLLDIVEGRSKKVFKSWLAAQSRDFRCGVEEVAMDGFAGYKSAAAEELPDATPVMDPFHVVALAGSAVERCRQRILSSPGFNGDIDNPEGWAAWSHHESTPTSYASEPRGWRSMGADASSGDISFLGVQAASATAGVCRASSNTTGVIRPSPSCFLLR